MVNNQYQSIQKNQSSISHWPFVFDPVYRTVKMMMAKLMMVMMLTNLNLVRL